MDIRTVKLALMATTIIPQARNGVEVPRPRTSTANAQGEPYLRVDRIPPRNGKKKQFPQAHWEKGWVWGKTAFLQ
jgi:hypothetical protein